jgi:hypothetical protein
LLEISSSFPLRVDAMLTASSLSGQYTYRKAR